MLNRIKSTLNGGHLKQREGEVMAHLEEIGASATASQDFCEEDAFFRAYGAALALSVPEHVITVAFPKGRAFPAYDRMWEQPDGVFEDLASILAWRQCLAAFFDVEAPEIAENKKQNLRQTLMNVCGSVFPASDRAATLMQKYETLLDDETEQNRLRQTYFMTPENPSVAIHFMIVNECLNGPDLRMGGDVPPMHVASMAMFAMQTHVAAVDLFRTCLAEF